MWAACGLTNVSSARALYDMLPAGGCCAAETQRRPDGFCSKISSIHMRTLQKHRMRRAPGDGEDTQRYCAGAGTIRCPASSLCLARRACLYQGTGRGGPLQDLRDDEAMKEAGSAWVRSGLIAAHSPGEQGSRTKYPDEGRSAEAQRHAQAAPVLLDQDVSDDGVGPSPPARRQLQSPWTCAASRVPHSA